MTTPTTFSRATLETLSALDVSVGEIHADGTVECGDTQMLYDDPVPTVAQLTAAAASVADDPRLYSDDQEEWLAVFNDFHEALAQEQGQ